MQLVQKELPMGLNTAAMDEWIEYRQDKKKPLSALALKKSQNFLLRFDPDHQQTIVDAAIMNDWQGLHAVEKRKEVETRARSLEQDLTDTSWAN